MSMARMRSRRGRHLPVLWDILPIELRSDALRTCLPPSLALHGSITAFDVVNIVIHAAAKREGLLPDCSEI